MVGKLNYKTINHLINIRDGLNVPAITDRHTEHIIKHHGETIKSHMDHVMDSWHHVAIHFLVKHHPQNFSNDHLESITRWPKMKTLAHTKQLAQSELLKRKQDV